MRHFDSCLTPKSVYRADVTNNKSDEHKYYYGISDIPFKEHYENHETSFKHRSYLHASDLKSLKSLGYLKELTELRDLKDTLVTCAVRALELLDTLSSFKTLAHLKHSGTLEFRHLHT